MTIASILALASVWLWNWERASVFFWSPTDLATDFGVLFNCVWNFATSATLFVGFLASGFLKNLKNQKYMIICFGAVGLILAILDAINLGTDRVLLFLTSCLIGIFYGLGFCCWIYLARKRSVRQTITEPSLALILTCGLFLLRTAFGVWENNLFALMLTVLATGCFAVMLARNRLDEELSTEEDEVSPNKRELTISMIILFGFGLCTQINFLIKPQVPEYAIGALVAGIILLIAAKYMRSSKAFVVIFTVISITMCLCLLLVLFFMTNFEIISGSASMIGFWLVFALILTLPRIDKSTLFISGSTPVSSLYLAIFFSALGMAKILFHLTPFVDDLVKIAIVAVLLAILSMAAFYQVGSRSNRASLVSSADPELENAYWREIQQEYGLTSREREVLILLVQDRSQTRIAEQLGLSLNTIKTYRSHLYTKLGTHDKQELLDRFSFLQ